MPVAIMAGILEPCHDKLIEQASYLHSRLEGAHRTNLARPRPPAGSITRLVHYASGWLVGTAFPYRTATTVTVLWCGVREGELEPPSIRL